MALFFSRKHDSADPKVIDLRHAIDLREPKEMVVSIVFGQPAPCPECGSPGYLDSIDPTERVMFQHCPSCYARWSIAEADILAAGRSTN